MASTHALCETLELRRLLSATLGSDGTLAVTGTNHDDRIFVYVDPKHHNMLDAKINNQTSSYGLAAVKGIVVRGKDGDDTISLLETPKTPIAIDASLSGGNGNDIITGGSGNDSIAGDGGNDTLIGATGNDTLIGDDGFDILHGAGGNDFLDGGANKDQLFGENGNDKLYGRGGNDVMHGGNGIDILYGDAGTDTELGQADSDFLSGGTGIDHLYGGSGSDYFNPTDHAKEFRDKTTDDYVNDVTALYGLLYPVKEPASSTAGSGTTIFSGGYQNGDFNYDGHISGDDYFIIDSNISSQPNP